MNKPARAHAKPLSQIAGKVIADAFSKQGFASTGLITHWPAIVGAEIADHAEPMRMIWPRRVHEDDPEPAALVLRVEGPVALEIQHLSGVIMERVNRFFGWRAVGRIQIRQAPLRRAEKKKPPPPPTRKWSRGLPPAWATSATTPCATRSRGLAPWSSERD